MKFSHLLAVVWLAFAGCTASIVTSGTLPNGTSYASVSVRDAMTNDNALIIYDKTGAIHSVVPGTATTAGLVLTGAANAAVIAGGWGAVGAAGLLK